MKTTTILFCLVLSSSLIFGQDYNRLLEPGKTWTVESYDDVQLPPVSSQMTFYYQGDTIFEGTSYMNFGLNTFMREDTISRQVFLYDPGFADNEFILYDFSLEEGESLNGGLLIESVDSVQLTTGEYRSRWHYTTNSGEFYIEGIGSRDGFRTISDPIGPPNYDLMCVKKDGVEIYGSRCNEVVGVEEIQIDQSLIKVYPNPSSSVFYVESEYELLMVEVLDQSGRLIKSFQMNKRSYDISEISSGLYSVRIHTNKGIVITALAIE